MSILEFLKSKKDEWTMAIALRLIGERQTPREKASELKAAEYSLNYRITICQRDEAISLRDRYLSASNYCSETLSRVIDERDELKRKHDALRKKYNQLKKGDPRQSVRIVPARDLAPKRKQAKAKK